MAAIRLYSQPLVPKLSCAAQEMRDVVFRVLNCFCEHVYHSGEIQWESTTPDFSVPFGCL